MGINSLEGIWSLLALIGAVGSLLGRDELLVAVGMTNFRCMCDVRCCFGQAMFVKNGT